MQEEAPEAEEVMEITSRQVCDSHRVTVGGQGKAFYLHPTEEDVDHGAKSLPICCDVCGEQADWLVVKTASVPLKTE